jgi:hypothetical protein
MAAVRRLVAVELLLTITVAVADKAVYPYVSDADAVNV